MMDRINRTQHELHLEFLRLQHRNLLIDLLVLESLLNSGQLRYAALRRQITTLESARARLTHGTASDPEYIQLLCRAQDRQRAAVEQDTANEKRQEKIEETKVKLIKSDMEIEEIVNKLEELNHENPGAVSSQ